jgi:Carboxypeptidase regulatory-like domain
LGTLHDPSGALVSNCLVTIENAGTSAKRSVTTEQDGSYSVPKLEPGTYKIIMEAVGFQQATYTVELLARQTVRVDGQMSVASQSQTVNVAESAPVLNTDVSNIAETKTGRELVDLPVAIATRAGGSTSPMSTLTTQSRVQTDASGNISVAGAKPVMIQATARFTF